MENMLNVILPYIITAIGGYLTVKIVKIVPSVISYIIAKVGVINYNKMKAVGLDIYNAIEENFRIGKLVNSKAETFDTLIRTKFPNITDDEINIIRQAIAREFNKDKEPVEKAIEATESAEVPTDTNAPSTIVNEPTAPNTTNEDILNQIKDLVSKMQ